LRSVSALIPSRPAIAFIVAQSESILSRNHRGVRDQPRSPGVGVLVVPARHAPSLPEYARFFATPQKVARVKKSQIEYWGTFFDAIVDESYIEKRRRVGSVHATIGLSLQSYFAGMNLMFDLLTRALTRAAKDGGFPAGELAGAIAATTKLTHLDTSIVSDAFAELTERTISEQSDAIVAMSTPVAVVWDGILLIPVVGIIDSRRAQDIMSTLLLSIRDTGAGVCILDIGGVGIVDTAVANHFIKITKATRLMGCECIISGLSPAVTQTIVELGVDVSMVSTRATLRDALAIGFQKTGNHVVQSGE